MHPNRDQSLDTPSGTVDRRAFLQGAAAGAAALAVGPRAAGAFQAQDRGAVVAQIAKQHDATVKLLQDWIPLPSIAAENKGYPEGAEDMAKLARDAGFQQVDLVPTAGKPGVFATFDAGARTSLAIYFMYDVKQYDPAEWSSPPLEGRLVDKPGFGKVIVGRGATNTKGPQIAFLAALRAFQAAGKKLPVNLVLVCEGEEEIGSQLPADRLQAGGGGRPPKMRRHHHPPWQPVARRVGRGQPRRQGRDRGRAGFDLGEMGPGPQARRPLELRGVARQPRLAPGPGPEHPGQAGRSHPGRGGSLRQGEGADR